MRQENLALLGNRHDGVVRVFCSVVIPLYNKASHIRRAVESVLNQSLGEFELIVVDDGSTDGGGEIVRQMCAPRTRLICQANAGVSAARNRGIDESRADLVAFLDADDEWKPSFLKTIARLRARYPQCGGYATSYERLFADGSRRSPACVGDLPPGWEGVIDNYFQLAARSSPFCSSSCAITKEAFRVAGSFPVGIALAEDEDMWVRLSLKWQIAWSTLPEVVYHQATDNRATERLCHTAEPGYVTTADEALAAGQVPVHLVHDLREYMAIQRMRAVPNRLRFGDRRTASLLLERSSSTTAFRRQWLYYRCLAALPTSIASAWLHTTRSLAHTWVSRTAKAVLRW